MRLETHICMSTPGILLEMSRMVLYWSMSTQFPKAVLKISALYYAGHTTQGEAACVLTYSRIGDSLRSRNLGSSLGSFCTLMSLSELYV